MADEDTKKPKSVYFPSIPPKVPLTALSYSKSVQEAPYRALVGVVIDGKVVERHAEIPRYRIRRQTGLTNRWRLPESLYSDLLGSSQALKAINMPFNQNLVEQITSRYPSCNPNLRTIADFKGTYMDNDWSWLKHKKREKSKGNDKAAP